MTAWKTAQRVRRIVVALVACVVLCSTSRALAAPIPLDSTDTWDGPGTAGWRVRSGLAELTNTAQVMSLSLAEQGAPAAAPVVIGRPIGPGVMITNISFRLRPVAVRPSKIWFRLTAISGRTWYLPVIAPPAGEWAAIDLAVSYEQGWTLGAERPQAQFLEDRDQLVAVEVYMLRHGQTGAQVYEFDDFRFMGARLDARADWDMDGMSDGWELRHGLDPDLSADAWEDPDRDGLSNYGEWCAGTRPRDPGSVLAIGLTIAPGPLGSGGRTADGEAPVPMLWWPSATGRTYRLWRSTNLLHGFSPLESGIDATPDRNTFLDSSATGEGPFFYRVEVE